MSHIALKDAQLCLDCSMVGDNPHGCVVCLSKAVHPLAKFLNRSTSELSHSCADLPNLPCLACAQ